MAYNLIAAVVTPFEEVSGSVDEAQTEALVEFLIEQGLDGLYVGGTTGEAVLQNVREREIALQVFARANDGRSHLTAQVGGGSLDAAIELGKAARDSGYQAISSIPPMYYGHRFDAIKSYYLQLSQAVGLPMVVYNFPAGSGISLSIQQLKELLGLPGVAGIKHTSYDLYQLERLISYTGSQCYYGHDEQFLSALALGPYGFIGSTFNIMPHVYSNIISEFAANNLTAAQDWQQMANDVIDVLIEFGVLPSIKAILAMDGIDCGRCRAPLMQLTNQQKNVLRGVMEPVWDTRAAAANAAASPKRSHQFQ